MYFKQFYLGCLAHASYLIGSEGEAVVVDPQRDVDQYIDEAKSQGLKIRYVIETHLHADFVSGHSELAERTGAEIVFGRRADAKFPFHPVADGDEIELGQATLRFMETPGHTPESISILVTDRAPTDAPQKVLTGDTLFIGDVGRPDLVGSKGYSAEDMASMLYSSLHDKLLRLDDAVEVYPAHGAGSLCGRNISKDTSSTIGQQRQFNYALKSMPEEEFVRMMTSELPPVPAYFPKDAELNRQGATPLDALPTPEALRPEDVNLERELILDVRPSAGFGTAHVPGSINIGLCGQFASWAGSLLSTDRPIVIVAESDDEVSEAVMRLARVGVDSVRGYVDGGIYAWDKAGKPTAKIEQIPVEELHDRVQEAAQLQVVDVRGPGEYVNGHAVGAVNIPLTDLAQRVDELDPGRPIAVICQGGYRSSAAASILEGCGFRTVANVVGGTQAWVSSGFEVETVAN